MFLKKVLNQPNLVGTVMIVLLFGAGFVYAFAFDGFNVETATGGEVEAWLAAAGGGGSGTPGDCNCGNAFCHVRDHDFVAEFLGDFEGVKKGCKSKKTDGSNPCGDQKRTWPCKLKNGCRTSESMTHQCGDQGCPKLANPGDPPRVIDVCDKSPLNSCSGKCS